MRFFRRIGDSVKIFFNFSRFLLYQRKFNVFIRTSYMLLALLTAVDHFGIMLVF